MGKSNSSWLQRIVSRSIVDRLASESAGIDIMVVDVGLS